MSLYCSCVVELIHADFQSNVNYERISTGLRKPEWAVWLVGIQRESNKETYRNQYAWIYIYVWAVASIDTCLPVCICVHVTVKFVNIMYIVKHIPIYTDLWHVQPLLVLSKLQIEGIWSKFTKRKLAPWHNDFGWRR